MCYNFVLGGPEVTLPYKQLHQKVGHDTLLTCIVSSNPAAIVTWFFGSAALSSSSKYIVTTWDQDTYVKVTGLLIRNTDVNDWGSYTCLASNNLGEMNKSVNVLGKA